MPECIDCKVELNFVETVEVYSDESSVEMRNIGICPKCKKGYKWTDVYDYSHYEDLEEV